MSDPAGHVAGGPPRTVGAPPGGLSTDRVRDLDATEAEARQLLGAPGPCATCAGSGHEVRQLHGGWTKEERCSACGGSGRRALAAEAVAQARRTLDLVTILRERDAELGGALAHVSALSVAAREYAASVAEYASAYDLLSADRERRALDAAIAGSALVGARCGYVRSDVAGRYVEAMAQCQKAIDACRDVPRMSSRFVTTDEARLNAIDALADAKREFDDAMQLAEGR